MELRRLSLYLALFVLAICSQSCSDAHSVQRRSVDDIYDDDTVMGDEATDDEAQNDAEDNTADDEDILESITTKPTTYNVTVGQTVRLECKVSPNNKPVIQWLKGEEPLYMGKQYMKNSHDERIKISPDEGNHDLFISQLRASDSGRYRCKVLQLPQPAIIDHELVVMEKPRIDAFKASNNGTVMEGTDVLLTCDVTGSPAPQIIWSAVGENGMNARLTEKDASFNYNTALIKSIRPDQAGRYLCYVINSQGAAQAELRIRVLHKPHVHVHKQIVNSAPGIEAILQCSAHGEPIPHIVWYKDGRMVDFNDMKYVINTEGPHSNLTVTPTEDNDFGTFTCEARNLHGTHNNSIELAQRPVVEGLDLDGNKLTWKVHSHQPLEQIELQLRDTQGVPTSVNVPVPETKNHEYEVIYVLDNVDQGTYEVVVKAKNNKEWSSASEPIVVNYEVPLPIQTASIYHGNSHSIRPAANVVLSTVFMYLLVRLF